MRLGIRAIAIFAAGAAAIALFVLFATDSDESASPSAAGVRTGSQVSRDASGESLRFELARLRLELGEESRARRKLEGAPRQPQLGGRRMPARHAQSQGRGRRHQSRRASQRATRGEEDRGGRR